MFWDLLLPSVKKMYREVLDLIYRSERQEMTLCEWPEKCEEIAVGHFECGYIYENSAVGCSAKRIVLLCHKHIGNHRVLRCGGLGNRCKLVEVEGKK